MQREALARFARGRIDAEGKREDVAARRGHGVAGGVRGEKGKVCYPTCHLFSFFHVSLFWRVRFVCFAALFPDLSCCGRLGKV